MSIQYQETFHSVEPECEIIRKHISYYYFHSSFEKGFTKQLQFFPHYKNGLTAYLGAKGSYTERGAKVEPGEPDDLVVMFTRMQHSSASSVINAPFNKLGVVFDVLGMNYFLQDDFCNVSHAPTVSFNYYGEEFNVLLKKVFRETDLKEKARLLDKYFLSKYNPILDERIEEAVRLLFDIEKDYSVTELAEKLYINRRTLLRLFKKHLCTTVEQFKIVLKFRKALNYYQQIDDKSKMVDLSYIGNFYDQSDFIAKVKAKTGLGPKAFFNKIQKYGEKDTYWIMERVE